MKSTKHYLCFSRENGNEKDLSFFSRISYVKKKKLEKGIL